MNAPRSGCPINLTLEALGDRWSLIVIRDLMFGNRRHFRELLTRSEERIASNILADRLTRLEKAGLVSRRDDPSHKQKVIYSLTEASIALVPLLAHMGGWGLVTHPRRKSSPYARKSLRTRPEAVVRVHGGTAAPPPGGAGARGVGLLQAAVGLRSRHC
jgi:DNA-binding HxlR family transcriptional regulator